jgi:ribosome biogenesis GTPase / thiamine phosphate phosphatase
MTRRGYDVDDHEQFDRPRRHTRPRTKERPAHLEAISAFVVAVDRGRYTCLVSGEHGDRLITAMKSRPLGRKGVVVGDRVRIVGDVSGDSGSLARIVEVMPRATVLRRTADDDDPVERVVVANADQLVVVAALADPPPRRRLIDRCLVAAYDAGLDPLLCLTKPDLADPEDLLSIYRPLGVPYVITHRGKQLSDIKERLIDRISVLVGHSGVGKSTLVNGLVPGTDRAIGHVNIVTGRGRHTSTSVVALRLPFGGWVVDTPGIRSFGLAHVDVNRIIEAFPDLAALTGPCPRGCTHGEGAPECGLDLALASGETDAARVESFRRLLASRDQPEDD